MEVTEMADYAQTLDANAKMRKRPKPQLEAIHLSKAENGGVIARHRMSEYMGKEPEHVFGSDEGHKLAQHLEKHLGIKMKMSEMHGEQNEEPEPEPDED
jgi:hypothetical protein